MERKRELILIDGYGMFFRCFFAAPDITTCNGISIGAINAFITLILRMIQNNCPKSDYYIVIALDKGTSNNTFRHRLYPEYKANRPSLPTNLLSQLKILREALNALNIPYIECNGHEADDVIGCVVNHINNLSAKEKDDAALSDDARTTNRDINQITIVSMDKDLMQLIDENVRMRNYKTSYNAEEYIDKKGVYKKLSVEPKYVADYLALIGDKSDNIPGVMGIGPKIAASLIADFGDLDGIYGRIDMVMPIRIREKLISNKEIAFLSRQLTTIHRNIPELEIPSLNQWLWNGLTRTIELSDFLEKYELHGLTRRIDQLRR